MNPRAFLFWLVLSAAWFAPMTVLAVEPAGELVGSVDVPAKLEDEQVRLVLAETFLARRWSVDTEGEHVVGHLVHRGFDATVTAVHREGKVELYCDGWKINKRGEHLKREVPRGWIANLLKDLPIRLTRAALRTS